MLTTCPECRTTFRLSHPQLEARRGLVRCGHCRAVFNAFDTLLPEPDAQSAPPPPVASDEPAEALPDWDIPPPTLPESLRRSPQEDSGSDAEPPLPDEDEAFVLHLSDRVEAETAAPAEPDSTDAILLSDLPGREEAPPRRGRWLGALLGPILFLLLLAQSVFFLRGALVAGFPELRPGLETMCRPLGCRIPPGADAALIRIESSSLETDPEQANRATLRVSFSNRAQQAQKWPYLVLKLTDWQGAALAQRAFKPADYLGKDRSQADGMAAGSEHEIRLVLDLGGLSASGYEVVAKYP